MHQIEQVSRGGKSITKQETGKTFAAARYTGSSSCIGAEWSCWPLSSWLSIRKATEKKRGSWDVQTGSCSRPHSMVRIRKALQTSNSYDWCDKSLQRAAPRTTKVEYHYQRAHEQLDPDSSKITIKYQQFKYWIWSLRCLSTVTCKQGFKRYEGERNDCETTIYAIGWRYQCKCGAD